LLIAVVVAAAGITQSLVSPQFRHHSFTEFVAVLVAAYSLAVHAGWRARIAGAVLLATLATTIVLRDPTSARPGDLIEELALLGAAWAVGALVRRRYDQASAAERRTELVRREQEDLTRQAVADERSRISRELHDLVAHCVGVMVVQAGAGRVALDHDTVHARTAFLAIEDTGRHALADMRRLVGLLREANDPSPWSPQPGLADLEPLIERVRASGLQVNVDIRRTPRAVSPGLDLAAYRIIQEALTNVVKHARASWADVRVDCTDTALELAVADDGCASPADATPPADGHGLVGMRERVQLYGGEFRAAPRREGGFELWARLPLEEVPR
jgi:signal transduction histidine kinase